MWDWKVYRIRHNYIAVELRIFLCACSSYVARCHLFQKTFVITLPKVMKVITTKWWKFHVFFECGITGVHEPRTSYSHEPRTPHRQLQYDRKRRASNWHSDKFDIREYNIVPRLLVSPRLRTAILEPHTGVGRVRKLTYVEINFSLGVFCNHFTRGEDESDYQRVMKVSCLFERPRSPVLFSDVVIFTAPLYSRDSNLCNPVSSKHDLI